MNRLVIAFCLLFSACAPFAEVRPRESNPCAGYAAPPAAEKPSAIALVIHGLNNKPEVMADVEGLFKELGYQVFPVVLSGHARGEDWSEVKGADSWIRDLQDAYCISALTYPGAPIIVAGFSAGSSVALAFLQRYENVNYDAALFFAPSFALRDWVAPLRIVSRLRWPKISIPSAAPEAYRARSSTPLYVYRALYELNNEIAQRPPMRPVRALVVLHAEDQLVSVEGSRQFAREHGFDWKFLVLDETPAQSEMPAHLLVVRGVVGERMWRKIRAGVAGFLLNKP